jgi:cobalamin biosynthesis Mg chelatase CobN
MSFESNTLTFNVLSVGPNLFSSLRFSFSNASFDLLVGTSTSTFGTANTASYRLRRPARGQGVMCSAALPPRPTDPPTPMPPTLSPTPATSSSAAVETSAGSTAVTVPTVRVTTSTAPTTTTSSGSSTSGGGLVIGSNGQMSGGEVADDEPQSAIDATGIGLIVAGVLLLIISALVVWYVIAKRAQANKPPASQPR